MRLPVPTRAEVRLTAWFCAIGFIILATTGAWAIVHKVNQSDQIVRVATSAADQVERLNAQLDTQAKADAIQRAADAAQRAELQRQNQLTRAQLQALLRYLRAHGIQVPQTALTPPPDHGTVTRPKGTGPRGPAPKPHQPAPLPTPLSGSPTPTAPPSPTPSPDLVGSLCDLLRLSPCPLH